MLKYELTDEQKSEFNTENLQKFANAYLNFMHSSPYTSKRKVWGYFSPPNEEHADENDILYGCNRDQAYKELMSIFSLCRFLNEFDPLFGDKTLYWKSKTLPGLVLLKKWFVAHSKEQEVV